MQLRGLLRRNTVRGKARSPRNFAMKKGIDFVKTGSGHWHESSEVEARTRVFPQGDMEGALADYTVLAEMHPETPQLAKIVTELEAQLA